MDFVLNPTCEAGDFPELYSAHVKCPGQTSPFSCAEPNNFITVDFT